MATPVPVPAWAYPVILALTSHIYFNRQEPTLKQFFIIFGFGYAAALCAAFTNQELLSISEILHLTAQQAIAYLASLLVSITAYRLSPLHPLAHIPGPIALRVSKLTGLVAIWLPGKGYKELHRLHTYYGDFVRIGVFADFHSYSAILSFFTRPERNQRSKRGWCPADL